MVHACKLNSARIPVKTNNPKVHITACGACRSRDQDNIRKMVRCEMAGANSARVLERKCDQGFSDETKVSCESIASLGVVRKKTQ
jgi:hypothetical protein